MTRVKGFVEKEHEAMRHRESIKRRKRIAFNAGMITIVCGIGTFFWWAMWMWANGYTIGG